jgi:signal transduction histidine kinase
VTLSAKELLVEAIAATAPHRLFFSSITGVVALLVGGGAFLVWREGLKQEKWVLYFSVAFLLFSGQYLVPSGFEIYERYFLNYPSDRWIGGVGEFIAVVASSANNVAFLALARVLMRKKNVRPWWVWFVGVFGFLAGFIELWHPWHRLPVAVVSALALGMVGRALFENIRPRKRRGIAIAALAGGVAYALLNLAYAIPPLVASDRIPGLRSSIADRLSKIPEPNAIADDQPVIHSIDTFLFAWALPLKILLATCGGWLIVRAIVVISPRYLQQALAIVEAENPEFFTGRALLQPICLSLDADRVRLSFRLPGLSDRQVASWRWERLWSSDHHVHEPEITSLPMEDDSPEGTVFAKGTSVENPCFFGNDIKDSKGRSSMIIAPIRQHGYVIGCLTVEWGEAYAFTATAVHQVSRLANLLAPMIEERRQLAALDRWGRQIQTLDLGTTTAYSGRAVAGALAKLIYDTLSPAAVALSFNIGFRAFWAVNGETYNVGYLNTEQIGREVEDRLLSTVGLLTWVTTPLYAKKVPIGTLWISWPVPVEHSDRPVIFSDELHRKTIGSLVSAAFLEAAQIGFWGRLNRLQIDFNSESTATRATWFSALTVAILESGPLWVVLQQPDGDLLGPPAATEIISCVVEPHSTYDDFQSIELIENQRFGGELDRVVRLLLPTTRHVVWLGIQRAGFGPELDETWPWKNFLHRLIEAADAALARILAREEVQRLQREAEQFKTLMTASADPMTFIHEIKNLARNFQSSAQALDDARRLGHLRGPNSIENNVANLNESANRLYALTSSILDAKPIDPRATYPLNDVITQLGTLLKPIFDEHRIELEVAVSPEFIIVFPFHFAHQALLSLVTNSIDALGRGGKIWINAENSGEHISCHVVDNGPGIPDDLIEKVFDLGVSTKSATGGKGLFLVRNLVREYDGDALLTNASPGKTTFTLLFPSPKAADEEKA